VNERDRVEELIDQIMVEEFEVEPRKLVRGASLVKDLDLDSLDGVDLVVALEKTFLCRIPEDEVKKIRTLGDIYDKVRAMLSARETAAQPSV
jgi:acyl carrier protein